MLDYQIVVPSRHRSHNMGLLRRLLPSALICIDEREREDYTKVGVPAESLLIHPPMEIAATVRNWIQDAVKSEILIQVDDDFEGVKVTTGSQRWIDDSEEILAIIENAATAIKDLDLTTFCFSGTPNTTIIRPDERPIVPVQQVFRAFGTRGAARHRKYRTDMIRRADLDWTLRTLLEDRCVYADVRFYFDCGAVFAGRGGNVGLVQPEQFETASRNIRRAWGKHVSYKAPGFVKNREVIPAALRVSRTNKIAQR